MTSTTAISRLGLKKREAICVVTRQIEIANQADSGAPRSYRSALCAFELASTRKSYRRDFPRAPIA
jgi:hypothetical protein